MLLVIFLVAFIASAASAATGHEFPVAIPTPTEAPFNQIEPSLASNAADYYAVWRDERRSTDNLTTVTLYGSRVDARGQFLQPYGTPIDTNVYRAAVASNGRGYVVVYSKYTGPTLVRHVTDDGLLDPASSTLPGSSYIYSLTSNGSGFLALMSDAASDSFNAVFLDAGGQPLDVIDLGHMRDPKVVAAGSDYRIVDMKWACDGQTACIVTPRLTSISDSAHTVSQTDAAPPVSQWTRVNAIATDRIFIALISDGNPQSGQAIRTVSVEVIGFDGHVIAPMRVIATPPEACICGTWRASLATDGTNVLVAWPQMRLMNGVESDSRIVGIRVAPDGTSIDGDPFEIAPAVATEFVSATSRNGVLLLSSEQHNSYLPYYYGTSDVFARAVRSLADLTVSRSADAIAESSAGQFDSAVATSGSRAIVVWREHDQPSAIRANTVDITTSATASAVTLGERSNVVRTGLSVAALGDVALAVWTENTDQSLRIMGRRIGLDGVVLDQQPLLIVEQKSPYLPPAFTSIATDGAQFLVVWTADQDVFAARVARDGTLVDQEPILVSFEQAPHYHLRLSPRVVWNGTVFLVAWSDDIRYPGLLISPPIPPQTIVRTARVTSSGVVLDSIESRTIVNVLGPIATVSLASNGPAAMVAWSGSDDNAPSTLNTCVHVMPLDRDGAPTRQSPVQVDCEAFGNSSDTPLQPAITAKDGGFVVFWSSNSHRDVRGRLLTTNAIAGPPFVVSPAGYDASQPAAASSPFGTLVTYTRIATEPEYGGSPRVFGRVLDAAPKPKQRAVKR